MTAQGGVALEAECTHGLGVCGVADRSRPGPGSTRGEAPSVCVDRLSVMLHAGGRSLEDLRAWRREAGLVRRLDRATRPDPDPLGEWLRRRGDPQTGHAGLVGLGRVRDARHARLWRRDGPPLHVGCGGDAGGRGSMPMLEGCETPVGVVDACREGHGSPGAGPLACDRPGRARMPVGKRLARDRADRASYQAARIKEVEADQVRGASTADQDVAVKAVSAGLPPAAWQEPEQGGGEQVAEAGPTMQATPAACRLSITREARPPGDRCEDATGPDASHGVASQGGRKNSRPTRCWAGTISAATRSTSPRHFNTGWGWSRGPVASPGLRRCASGSGCWPIM